MAEFSNVISMILEKLGSNPYKEIMFAKDLDYHIKRLQQLKSTIEATLLDVGSLESCAHAQRDMLEKLDCALSDLDYFLDAKAAKAKKKEIMHGNRFIKEVRLFFSKSNQLVSPFRDAYQLKAIIDQFESISRNQTLVRDIISMPSGSKTQIARAGSLWSNYHILTEVVIGRDKDREEIVSMLLDDPLSSQAFSVVSIVGIGGVGKTTLAKYVYHDERVRSSFDARIWVSATREFDVQKVLLKILETFQDEMAANCDIDHIYDCVKQVISKKKFLLVLDNIWDQESLWQKWKDLKGLLALGGSGSKVLVTTRNEKVTRIMDCCKPYLLRDLTEENSWLLFQEIVFGHCQDPSLEAIGREIVKMCPNVPLVIRSIGGLLAGKCTAMEWMAFKDDQLANFTTYGRDIMQTLKLSYDQLNERLRLCVAYCSLFPKGYFYDKSKLITLWISLGYIKPSHERQCLEDAAKESMVLLTVQGFFITDQQSSNYLRMHELMHDLVLSIVDFKYKVAEADTCEFDERVRHLSLVQKESGFELSPKVFPHIFELKQLQSLLVLDWPVRRSRMCLSNKIFSVYPRLRILSLSKLGIENLPSCLGDLVTLRYLDLSGNFMTRLPKSVTHLVELLSLDVSYCRKLFEFPKGMGKLVTLRHIRNNRCPALIPKGVASLKDLQTLDEFQLEFSERFPREVDCGLPELNNIINRLTDGVTITINGDAVSRSYKGKEEYWKSKGNLVWLILKFVNGSTKGDEMVIEGLQPNTNLRELFIEGYKGERLPRWMNDGIHKFEKLVDIQLKEFKGCRSLGSFGRLRHLKKFECKYLQNVEYIEEYRYGGTTSNAPLFPSLKQLKLIVMPKLKKWYNVSNGENSSASSFVQVQHKIPLSPKLGFPKLRELYVPNIEFLISMTREFRGFSNLETLTISNCGDFKAIPDGIPNQSNLKQLFLFNCCEELKERCGDPIGEDWSKIKYIPEVYLD